MLAPTTHAVLGTDFTPPFPDGGAGSDHVVNTPVYTLNLV
jgi:hypothetical protein